MKELSQAWKDLCWIGFDTETTGKYPLESELCEVAAVLWKDGKIQGEFHSLIRPSRPMGEEVIRIHNITNEMVAEAPTVDKVIPEFYEFMRQGIPVAHHAPFDLGFLAIEMEKKKLGLPELPVVCSSRLSRRILPYMPNHKLQTLVKELALDPGQAHRALDDARNCLDVALHCFGKLGNTMSLEEILNHQEGPLYWKDYSLDSLRKTQKLNRIVEALQEGSSLMVTYEGGSKPGKARRLYPLGIVRNPDGDYMVARENSWGKVKRYLLEKVSAVE